MKNIIAIFILSVFVSAEAETKITKEKELEIYKVMLYHTSMDIKYPCFNDRQNIIKIYRDLQRDEKPQVYASKIKASLTSCYKKPKTTIRTKKVIKDAIDKLDQLSSLQNEHDINGIYLFAELASSSTDKDPSALEIIGNLAEITIKDSIYIKKFKKLYSESRDSVGIALCEMTSSDVRIICGALGLMGFKSERSMYYLSPDVLWIPFE